MAKTKHTYQLHDSTGHWIARLYNSMRKEFHQELTKRSATISEWAVLAAIHSGADTPSEIADMSGMDRAVASRTLDQLEEKQLVKRSRQRINQRSITVTATAAGKKLLRTLIAENQRIQARYYAGFSKKQMSTFRDTLKLMLENGNAIEEEQ